MSGESPISNLCALEIGLGRGGGRHAHPHFVWERDEGVQCGRSSHDTIDSEMDVDDFNAGNVNFSLNDKRVARGANGGGQDPCQACGDGEVANDGGTECVACEHGESSAGGTCNSDPCDGVYCPTNAHCDGGQCQCDAGYKQTYRLTGDSAEPELVLECVPDPCHGVVCGKNSSCSNGQCRCSSGYHDPDGDGDCSRDCPAGFHDPDADGVCTRVCRYSDIDVVARASLTRIPKEPWERGEPYLCSNNAVVVGPSYDNRNTYENRGDVCDLQEASFASSVVAAGHSHPYFEWDPSKTVEENTVRCGTLLLDTPERMSTANMFGVNFSMRDRDSAMRFGKPLYLVVPERDVVKVYRHPEHCSACEWAVEVL